MAHNNFRGSLDEINRVRARGMTNAPPNQWRRPQNFPIYTDKPQQQGWPHPQSFITLPTTIPQQQAQWPQNHTYYAPLPMRQQMVQPQRSLNYYQAPPTEQRHAAQLPPPETFNYVAASLPPQQLIVNRTLPQNGGGCSCYCACRNAPHLQQPKYYHPQGPYMVSNGDLRARRDLVQEAQQAQAANRAIQRARIPLGDRRQGPAPEPIVIELPSDDDEAVDITSPETPALGQTQSPTSDVTDVETSRPKRKFNVLQGKVPDWMPKVYDSNGKAKDFVGSLCHKNTPAYQTALRMDAEQESRDKLAAGPSNEREQAENEHSNNNDAAAEPAMKRGRGRPKGSKNKPKVNDSSTEGDIVSPLGEEETPQEQPPVKTDFTGWTMKDFQKKRLWNDIEPKEAMSFSQMLFDNGEGLEELFGGEITVEDMQMDYSGEVEELVLAEDKDCDQMITGGFDDHDVGDLMKSMEDDNDSEKFVIGGFEDSDIDDLEADMLGEHSECQVEETTRGWETESEISEEE